MHLVFAALVSKNRSGRAAWRAVAHAFPQPRQYQRGSSGRAESHPAGHPRGDGRLVALAGASPPSGESHTRLVDVALAGMYLADRHSLVELPRDVVGRDLVGDI